MEELKCDVCGAVLTQDNIGFAKNSMDGSKTMRCKNCHNPDKSRKESSYRVLE